ncbi:ABC transporter permease [Paenibacillus filicis]|uniref:ABC transporter permease n=1 Tax=Paenibacillus filicis TaxID=669464 RepID=A0ABU9DED6_9BACL
MFIRLVHNELLKFHYRKLLYGFALFLIAAIGIIGLVNRFMLGWTDSTQSGAGFAHTCFSVLGLFIMVFSAALSAQTIADEFKEGTIKQLLIRPPGRSMILLSKYAAVIIVMLSLLIVTLLISAALGAILFRGHSDFSWLAVVKVYAYRIPEYLFFITLSLLTGTLVRSPVLAITLAIVTNFMGQTLTAALSKYSWSKLLIFGNLSLQSYDSDPLIRGLGTTPFTGILPSAAIILIYMALLLYTAAAVFRKTDIN